MLSPDNYVSLPEHTQGYNRYSYALNNPLIITDPSGDNPAIIAMIAYSAIVSGLNSANNGDGFLQGFATGVATGALSAGVGAVIGPVVSGSTRLAFMANAGIHTAVAGGITYGIDALANNSSFNWKGYGLNIATSMAFAGLTYQKPGAQPTHYSRADLEAAGITDPRRGYGMSLGNPPYKLVYSEEGFMIYDIAPTEIVSAAAGGGANQYQAGVESFSYYQAAFTNMENIGPKGGYFVKGYSSIYQSNGKWYIKTSASGNCPGADVMGIDISFNGKTDLIVNGKVVQSQNFGIINEATVGAANYSWLGYTNMQLPTTGSVQLRLNVSYIMTDPGGRAVPLPSLTRTLSIYK
ncbi:MAG TPA: hypothetical protein DG754_09345 [Bacteroidales bacterium]|nr:hypothetical protein [Bacteroidales bacterium]